MNKPASSGCTRIPVIGDCALQILSCANDGKVVASVTNAVYLMNQAEDVCWFIPAGHPMHPRAIQVEGDLPLVKAGAPYRVDDHRLIINSREALEYSQALVWKSPAFTADGSTPLEKLFTSLFDLNHQLLAQNPPSGFGCLIKPLMQPPLDEKDSLDEGIQGRAAERAWPSIRGIISASITGDIDQWKMCAGSLVGLGAGLTPCGDDFLGGFVFAFQFLVHTYPQLFTIPVQSYVDIILQMQSQTNLISYSILKDQTRGHSIEPLHQLANGLLLGKPIAPLYHYSKQLIAVGHSTGWDILCGFTAGIATAMRLKAP